MSRHPFQWTENPAEHLQEALGQRLTAFAVCVSDPRAIGRYARGEEAYPGGLRAGLRLLDGIVSRLLERDSPETIRAWMMGANTSLDDRSPIEVFRDGDVEAVRRAEEEQWRG